MNVAHQKKPIEILKQLTQVEECMLRAVGEDGLGVIAAEHLSSGGKRMRARLVLQACAELGVAEHEAVAWAAAIELVHNASLVHDDLQDGDRTRRGVPTTWARHGAAQAINAGDLMLSVPYRILAHVRLDMRWPLAHILAKSVEAMSRGQAEEPALRERCTWGAYRSCVRGKTSALLAGAVEGACVLAGRNAAFSTASSKAFSDIGEAFQMQDDVLDLFGDKGRGVRGADIDEGKISSLVIAHCSLHPAEQAELFSILNAPRGSTMAGEIARTIERFRAGGALLDVLERIDSLCTSACASVPRELAPLAMALAENMQQPIQRVRAELSMRRARKTLRQVAA